DKGNNETNAFDDVELPDGTFITAIDTDGDSFCDGDGSNGGCPGMTKDECPTVPGKGTANGCGDELPCLPLQALLTTNPEYVDRDGAHMPTGLKMNPETNVPLIFELKDENGRPDYQKMATLCGDFDKDGIPDCVENPFVNASCEDTETGLKFNRADTDGDGFIDGIGRGTGETRKSDVCPVTLGSNDDFAEGKANYSCDPRQVYKMRPIVSCFLDRDGDGLRDCEEDLDMDGQFNSNQNPGIKVVDGQIMLNDEVLATIETDTLAGDTDGDGLDDLMERTRPVKSVDGVNIHTNPANHDTDGDGFTDGDEDRNADGIFTINVQDRGSDGCPQLANLLGFDTDPTRKDSDGDGIDDKLELSGGAFMAGSPFLQLISDVELIKAGIAVISDPMTVDSDGDGLLDGQEYAGGKVYWYNSNPCMHDSDNDGKKDKDEFVGCALSPDPTCSGDGTYMRDKAGKPGSEDTSKGIDTDGDNLADDCEQRVGTDPFNNDSDGDGLLDGEEIDPVECVYTPGKIKDHPEYKYVTDPLSADTDGDSLNDYLEYRYGADPTNVDTDGDCIPDGLEDVNLNGRWDAGETNALSADTDGDGLPDGIIRGIGEDLNCNGLRDQDAEARWLETDPTNPDSNFNGISDFEEMMSGGWNPSANIARATNVGGEGCSMSGAGAAPSGMIYLLGMLLVATKLSARRMRRKEK
nr:hypothetical protein [bacterium]